MIALTQRQRQVLLLVCDELTTKQIAQKLGLSEKTVQKHRDSIYARCKVSTQLGLLKVAVNNKFINIKTWLAKPTAVRRTRKEERFEQQVSDLTQAIQAAKKLF